MRIQFHGDTTFSLQGKKANVLIDGSLEEKADAYFFTTPAEGRKEPEGSIIFDWPGEYEVKGVSISSLPCVETDNQIFYFEIDGIKVCHLGKLKEKLTQEMVQEVSETDILLIPIKESDTLSAKQAHEIIEEIEPRVVIPMNFEDADLDAFRKEMSIQNIEPQDKLDVKSRSELPDDRTDYYILDKS